MGFDQDKIMLTYLWKLGDQVENDGYWKIEDHSGLSIRVDIYLCLKLFVYKIIVADENLAQEEFDFIKELLCTEDESRKSILKEIKDFKMKDPELRIPAFLKSFVKFDKANGTSLSSRAVKVLECIGLTAIAVDEDYDFREVTVLKEYVERLKSVLRAKRLQTDIDFDDFIGEVYSDYSHANEDDDDNDDFLDDEENEDVDDVSFDEHTARLEPIDKSKKKIETGKKSLDTLLQELGDLIGLPKVKNEIVTLTNLVKIMQIRKERNLPVPPMSLHLVFTGNPGTGKTTVARIIAQIYKEMGLLSKGHLVEVDRSGLVAGYVGQTALKVKEMVEKSMGGVLFIDEAYSLSSGNDQGDFGREAIDTILKAMEDYREDFVVIVAGYPEKMIRFIASNPGLQSRFNKYIQFEDYSHNELFLIMRKMCKDNCFSISEDGEIYLKKMFHTVEKHHFEKFGNARGVRNIFEKALSAQANRIAGQGYLTDSALGTLVDEDFFDNGFFSQL